MAQSQSGETDASMEDLARVVKAAMGKEENDTLNADESDRARGLTWTLKRSKDRAMKREATMARKIPFDIGAVIDEAKTDSPIESKLLTAMNNDSMCSGLSEPQYRVGPFWIDIAIPHVKLAIECDGRDFHSTPAQVEHDERRTNYLANMGWTVIRFTGSKIHNDRPGCIREIQLVLEKLCALKKKKEGWE